jgi:hypothetical protein
MNPPRREGTMSQVNVIVIHVRANQANDYERLFAEREVPRGPLSPAIFKTGFSYLTIRTNVCNVGP